MINSSRSVIKDGLDKKLRMMAAVSTVLEEFTEVWNSHQGMVYTQNRFAAVLSQAHGHVRVKSVSTTGVTRSKKEMEEKLISTLLQLQGAIWSLGNETNDAQLKAIGEIPDSHLERLRDIALLDWAKHVRTITQGLDAAFATHGGDAFLLDELNSQIQSFEFLVSKPIAMISNRVASTSELTDVVAFATAILVNSMDRHVKRFEKSHPDFFKSYQASRKVHRNAVRSTTGLTEDSSDIAVG
jgi:hypothetical protein